MVILVEENVQDHTQHNETSGNCILSIELIMNVDYLHTVTAISGQFPADLVLLI